MTISPRATHCPRIGSTAFDLGLRHPTAGSTNDSVFESQEVFLPDGAVPLVGQPEQLGKCPAHDHLASAFRNVTSVEHGPVLMGDGLHASQIRV